MFVLAKMQLIYCDDQGKIEALLKFGKKKLPSVTTIVHMDPVSPETVTACEEQGWDIFSFSDVEVCNDSCPIGSLGACN